jgi:hypothetical protein
VSLRCSPRSMREMTVGQTPEVLGGGGEGELFGFAGWSEISPFWQQAGLGEVAVDLANDRSFHDPEDFLLRRPRSV